MIAVSQTLKRFIYLLNQFFLVFNGRKLISSIISHLFYSTLQDISPSPQKVYEALVSLDLHNTQCIDCIGPKKTCAPAYLNFFTKCPWAVLSLMSGLSTVDTKVTAWAYDQLLIMTISLLCIISKILERLVCKLYHFCSILFLHFSLRRNC